MLPQWAFDHGELPAGAADGLTQSGAIEIFPQVHEGEERIEESRLHFVGQVQTAGRCACQHFAVVRDEADDLHLARVGCLAVYGFAAHLRTRLFDLQREMKHAQMHGIERVWDLSLAPILAAGGQYWHIFIGISKVNNCRHPSREKSTAPKRNAPNQTYAKPFTAGEGGSQVSPIVVLGFQSVRMAGLPSPPVASQRFRNEDC
jgi:hypothetical protein